MEDVMPRMSASRKTFARLGRKSVVVYPVATVAYYGPDNQRATKVAVGIVNAFNKLLAMERWSTTDHDIRSDEDVFGKMLAFVTQQHAERVVVVDGIIGCPHEEGIDYPDGESCPLCPFWKDRDRFTGELLT